MRAEGDDSLAPYPQNLSRAVARTLAMQAGRAFSVQTQLQGEALISRFPPLTSAILQRLDCRTPLDSVRTAVVEASGATAEQFDAQWLQLWRHLAGIGYLIMSEHMSNAS